MMDRTGVCIYIYICCGDLAKKIYLEPREHSYLSSRSNHILSSHSPAAAVFARLVAHCWTKHVIKKKSEAWLRVYRSFLLSFLSFPFLSFYFSPKSIGKLF